MKTGCIIINGTDIFTAFGVYAVQGSYRGLIEWAALKGVDKNVWQEQDGEEPDLSAMPLASRTFTMQFAGRKSGDYAGFCDFLESQHQLAVNVAEIGLSFTLRAVSFPAVDYAVNGFDLFSVTFTEDAADFHRRMYELLLEREENTDLVIDESGVYNIDLSPEGGAFAGGSSEYDLEGVPFSDFGVQVVKGTMSSVVRRANLKQYLTRASKYSNGQTYDQNPALWDANAGAFVKATTEGATRCESREMTLKCHLSAATAAQCWAYYYRFLQALTALRTSGDVTQRGAKTISLLNLGATAEVYYLRQSVTAFYPDAGHFWVDFDVVLQLISGHLEQT